MRHFMILLMLLLLSPNHLYAQTNQKDKTFKSFWTKFKAAVTKNNKDAVSSMTKLPFLFDSKKRTRSEFIKIYSQLFDAKVRKCFATAKVLKEGDAYEVFCAKKIFYFGEVDGRYR